MKKPRFSLGSIVMLLATLFVVIGMAAFLTLIAGDGVYERTRAVFGLLADQTEEATATPTDVPTASPHARNHRRADAQPIADGNCRA